MPFSKKTRMKSKPKLNQEELACIPLIILDQLKDYLIMETYTPLEFVKDDQGHTDILIKNLQHFHETSPPGKNNPCCFKLNCEGDQIDKDKCRLITIAPVNGSCPSTFLNSDNQGSGFSLSCPQTVSDVLKLLSENRDSYTLADALHIPKTTQRQKYVIENNKLLNTLKKQLLLQNNRTLVMDNRLIASPGCGH